MNFIKVIKEIGYFSEDSVGMLESIFREFDRDV